MKKLKTRLFEENILVLKLGQNNATMHSVGTLMDWTVDSLTWSDEL